MAKAVSSARTTRTKKSGTNGSGADYTPKVEELIRRRAFELFQESGAQHGRDQEHWFRAEAEIRSKTA